jgi:uncharacterized cofD-like protein
LHGESQRSVAPSPAPHITAIGGGHGLSAVLRGIKQHNLTAGVVNDKADPCLSAVVTAADDGGSSGALRRALKVQPLGDIRQCLLALSAGDPTLRQLFGFRFNDGLDHHSLGNLMLAALTLLEKDVDRAIERAGALLSVQGRVIPATTARVELLARLDDGAMIKGETDITTDGRDIRRISLLPADVSASPAAINAILASDLVVIGPGSLYTSLIPNLLLKDIVLAIIESGAHVALVMNLMAEPGETPGYSAADVITVLKSHIPDLPLHTVLLNDAPIPQRLLQRYGARGIAPISSNPSLIEAMGCSPMSCALLARGNKVRHDPHKLARALFALAQKRMRPERKRNSRAAWPTTIVE